MSDRNWYIGIAIGVIVLVGAVLIVVLPKKSGSGSEGGGSGGSGGGGGNMPDGCGNCFMADADCAPVPDQQGFYNSDNNNLNAVDIRCAKYFIENGKNVPDDNNAKSKSTFINKKLGSMCDILMVAKDGNCGSCYQQVYNAHLDKCTPAGAIRRDKPDMTCATLMADMDCGKKIDMYLDPGNPPLSPTDPDYHNYKQVQDCYFQAAQSYKNSFPAPPSDPKTPSLTPENIIQSCTQDCQTEDSHYFPFKPCLQACSDACNRP